MNITWKMRASRRLAWAVLFLFIVHSTVSKESTKVLKKSATWSTLIWLGRKWHCYGTDLWGSLKLFLFQTGKKPKCFHKAEWSHISCLHTICLYLSASGAILSKIHLQNIFTLKPVSGHEIKTAIKMFKAAPQCRFIWLQEQDLLYILQVLNAFSPDLWLKNAEYLTAGKHLLLFTFGHTAKAPDPSKHFSELLFCSKILFYWKTNSFAEACQHWPTLSWVQDGFFAGEKL